MKLSFYNTVYYINEEKKTVTCKTYYSITSSQSRLLNYMAHITDNDHPHELYAIGTARLYENDNWDIETGKKVARAKAETKAYEYVAKRANKIARDTMDISLKINGLCGTVSKMANKVRKHNDEYLSKF